MLRNKITFVWGVPTAFVCLAALLSTPAFARHDELPNRIAEPAPYNLEEAGFFGGFSGHAPPFENDWKRDNNPSKCTGCHDRIFDEWNGSMMANAWRDPGWRGAFLLTARATSTDGCGDINENLNAQGKALDGTDPYACDALNPFADSATESTYKTGPGEYHTTDGSGSLMDDFCSRCHMPSNYIDAVPLAGVTIDDLGNGTNFEHGPHIPTFDPTSAAGTDEAYATVVDAAQSLFRNTNSGKQGIFCEICHTNTESRRTPYSFYEKSEVDNPEYIAVQGRESREQILGGGDKGNLPGIPDANSPNLGYAIGAGAFRVSPHAIGRPERFGPIWNGPAAGIDPYLSDVFGIDIPFQDDGEFSRHDGYYQVKFDRAEFCGSCHDVTNPATILNTEDKWVGGFPIERTYTEYSNSRYAERPGNDNFDENFQRDCQTCHMQQDFGRPGTAQTLYKDNGDAIAPITGQACSSGPVREVFYSHHFDGGNSYVSAMIGRTIDDGGNVDPYPVLAGASFTSANKGSQFHNAYFSTQDKGPPIQATRLAWDRLRNATTLDISAPTTADAGDTVAISTLTITNDGSGHNFPTGFPEGRVAWVAVRAYDTGTGIELMIEDSARNNRLSLGVGYLTTTEMDDPNFPGCNFNLPPGSPDPYAYQMKAVATLGDGCPTLDLAYATPVNIVTNADGKPIDSNNVVIDRDNPRGIPQYTDVDGDGDVFDDAFLSDTRLSPLPLVDSTADLGGRYSVVIPIDAIGPIAVTVETYYQSFEAVVAEKFLGNLANTDLEAEAAFYLGNPDCKLTPPGPGCDRPLPLIEPCVLKGACDGRTPNTEPAAVEGAPPVALETESWVITLNGDNDAPTVIRQYPTPGEGDAYSDFVAKISFSEPVTGVNETTFVLFDQQGFPVPAFVDQIGDGTWGLFAHNVFLLTNHEYTAELSAGICDFANNCTTSPTTWSWITTAHGGGTGQGTGDTSIPLGFDGGGPITDDPPEVIAVDPADGANGVSRGTNVVVTFSEPVDGVDVDSFLLKEADRSDCAVTVADITGQVTFIGNNEWLFNPNGLGLLEARTTYCVTVTTDVFDQDDNDPPDNMEANFTSQFKTGNN